MVKEQKKKIVLNTLIKVALAQKINYKNSIEICYFLIEKKEYIYYNYR